MLRSGRATAHYAFASVLRCAPHCLTACSVSLTQPLFDVLPCFYTYLCFTLLDAHYQTLTRLRFFTLFHLGSFYLVLYSFSSIYKVKPCIYGLFAPLYPEYKSFTFVVIFLGF
ncbi:MAG: hypothetical protein NZ455_03545 [Bacteroidia bacterium]|nr:hypothetical protein [Bacteroidia bacterium]